MNSAQLISSRTPLVLYGAVCVVAAITLGGSGFIAHIPMGFWRTGVAILITSGFAYGVYYAAIADSDSFQEMGVRLVAFIFLVIFLYVGVRGAL